MLYSIIVSLFLGLLAVFPPYLGFLYTSKIIKEFKNRGLLKGLIIFILSGIGIGVIFNVIPLILSFYSVYGVIIALYFIFEKYDIGEWNKAFMSMVISALCLGIVYLLNEKFFLNLKELFAQQVVITIKKMDPNMLDKEILKMTKQVFEEFLSYSAVFIFLQNLFTTYAINFTKKISWDFSYVFLIGYISAFISIKYFEVDNVYVKNLLDTVKYLYILYGFSKFNKLINDKLNMKFLSFGITLLIITLQPALLFIYGSIKSFKLFIPKEED